MLVIVKMSANNLHYETSFHILFCTETACAMVNGCGCTCAAGLLEEIPDADKWIIDVLQSVT